MYLTKLASIQLVLWQMLEQYGEDPAPVFKQVKLNPSLMYKSGERYPLAKIAELWKEMGRRIKDPCFGLSAATCWHPSNFGTMGYALLTSHSLRVTFERLIRFHRVISDANFGELEEDKEKNTLSFILKTENADSYTRGREDAAIAWILSVLRVNYQKELFPEAVHLTHPKPPCSGKYYEFFRSPVYFNEPVSRMVFSLDIVDKVLASSNEELTAFGDQAMNQYISSLDTGNQVNRIREFIVENLPSGNVTVEQVAETLGMNTRTLQRALKEEEGTSFINLLNDTRMDIAKQFIQDKKMDLTEVAFLLGFAELSTFSRSFKRWTGKSPMQFRKTA
ncbi:MAG: hypothetical protein DSY80_09805 [Desulfocapsa sp.]|nr:MAG: hypothetical protein DSY80_09805 [Desulfocapsa sp.]